MIEEREWLMLQRNCRRCGGRGVPIVVGLPGPELFEAAERGEVVLDGCVIDGSRADRRQCSACGFRWGDMSPNAADHLDEFGRSARLDTWRILEALDDRFEPIVALVTIRSGSTGNDGQFDDATSNWDLRRNEAITNQLVLGDPGLVVLSSWADGLIEIDEVLVEWHDPSEPSIRRRGEPLLVPSLQVIDNPADRSSMLVRLIQDAGRRRSARFRRCGSCGLREPPEWMHDRATCMSCASKNGVVY